MHKFDTIESALQDLKDGKIIIVVDDESRENEGDFVALVENLKPETINFMATHGRGLICTPISEKIAKNLNLIPQAQTNSSAHHTAFTITIDAKENISTGISSVDRFISMTKMIAKDSTPADFVSPGHIFPLIAKDGGVLERRGHTEAAVDLAKLANMNEAGVICEILKDDGSMMRRDDLFLLAQKFDLKMITIEDLEFYRLVNENIVSEEITVPIPTKFGNFQSKMVKSKILGEEAIMIYKGDIHQMNNPLVRIHSECFTGDVLGSFRCDCGEQLEKSLKMINESNNGILFYLKQEGRGIGLFNKLKAYKLQDEGLDTIEANIQLGHAPDDRDYRLPVAVLSHLKIKNIQLMTNNPEKIKFFKHYHFNVSHVSLEIQARNENSFYLMTKKIKMGHMLNLPKDIQ
jgi:3,4-dihydroxy 2-butanone 4-phosphate synthase/GTP cyclohydrolase II